MLLPGMRQIAPAKGLCRGHYEQQRSKRSLQPLPSRRRGDPACSFEGCGNVAVNRGLCQAHANQRKKGQSLRPLRPFYGTQGPCRFDGCFKPRVAGGFCAGHAAQYYGGRPLAPCKRPDRRSREGLKLYQPELLNTHALDNWEKDAGDTPRRK